MSINKLNALLELKRELEEKIKHVNEQIKCESETLEEDEIKACDYEELNKLYHSIYYFINPEKKDMISNRLTKKKMEKYPQMLKPTYFPEIDRLDISNSEKLRLDVAARNNVRYYMTEDNINRLEYRMTIEDLERLTMIGIAEKSYRFKCPECNCICKIVSQKDLDKHKRTWELITLNRGGSITKEQLEELEHLEEDGYGYIYLFCMDDEEFEDEVSDMISYKKYEDALEVSYKIVKSPDLTYEKL